MSECVEKEARRDGKEAKRDVLWKKIGVNVRGVVKCSRMAKSKYKTKERFNTTKQSKQTITIDISRMKKWTREVVLEEIEKMLVFFQNNPKAYFLQDYIEPQNYSEQRFSEWVKVYQEDPVITEGMLKIKEMLEKRGAYAALGKEWNPIFSIFMFKNKHGWRDKTEVHHTHTISASDVLKRVNTTPRAAIIDGQIVESEELPVPATEIETA